MILEAKIKHIESILKVTKDAFIEYKEKLKADVKVAALEETYEDVLHDITNNKVFVYINENGVLEGSVRLEKLSDDLIYLFRYSVNPNTHGTGIGSLLINHVFEFCQKENFNAIALFSNAKNFDLARFYYGKGFYIHSTNLNAGYVRALFVKELRDKPYDLSPVFKK